MENAPYDFTLEDFASLDLQDEKDYLAMEALLTDTRAIISLFQAHQESNDEGALCEIPRGDQDFLYWSRYLSLQFRTGLQTLFAYAFIKEEPRKWVLLNTAITNWRRLAEQWDEDDVISQGTVNRDLGLPTGDDKKKLNNEEIIRYVSAAFSARPQPLPQFEAGMASMYLSFLILEQHPEIGQGINIHEGRIDNNDFLEALQGLEEDFPDLPGTDRVRVADKIAIIMSDEFLGNVAARAGRVFTPRKPEPPPEGFNPKF